MRFLSKINHICCNVNHIWCNNTWDTEALQDMEDFLLVKYVLSPLKKTKNIAPMGAIVFLCSFIVFFFLL